MRGLALAFVMLGAAAFGCSPEQESPEVKAEVKAREAFARAAVVDAGAAHVLDVGARGDVVFDDGFSLVSYDPPDDFHGNPFRFMGQHSRMRVRAHEGHRMHIHVRGWLNEKVIRSKAVVALYLDGELLHDTGAVENGHWTIDADAKASMLAGRRWLDLVMTVSAVAFQWAEPPELRVVVINDVLWTELP
jgi:hypothetical protein